jgi:hypothetical protein
MKLIISTFVLCVFFHFACDEIITNQDSDTNSSAPNGLMKITLDMTNAPTDVVQLEGKLYGRDREDIYFDFEIRDHSATATVDNILSGIWMLRVDAYNADNNIIYTGTKEITVYPGILTPVSIHLNPTTGSLEITITWGNYPKLVAYYPFNGNANDVSGNNNHGKVLGASLTNDRFGNSNSAYSFDGIDDVIALEAGIYSGHKISISAWFQKFGDGPDAWNSLVAGDCATPYLGVVHNLPTFGGQCNSPMEHQWPDSEVADSSWHHLGGIYDGMNIKLYLDNSKIIDNFVGSFIFDNTIPIGIGGSFNHFRDIEGFLGVIDEVRIFNDALTEEEINTLFFQEYGNLLDDQFEENDSQFEAAAIYEDPARYSDLVVSAHDDDWYALTLSASHLLIECGFNHLNGDINIDLVDINGTIITSAHSQTNNESIDIIIDALGTVYLHVYTTSEAGNRYTLWWDDRGDGGNPR